MATGNDGNVPSIWELPFIMVSTLQAHKWALRDEALRDEALQEGGGLSGLWGISCWSFQFSYKGSFPVSLAAEAQAHQ